MKKRLVITYEVDYNSDSSENDILRYCRELAEDASLVADFLKAELDGEVIMEKDKSVSEADLWEFYGAFEETAVSPDDFSEEE